MTTQVLKSEVFEGVFEVAEAAQYLRVTMPQFPGHPQKIYSSKLIRWIRKGLAHSKLVDVPGHELLITFEDLVSMRVIAFMRYLGYSFREIHKAEAFARDITGHDRPLATEKLWVEELGAVSIYTEIEGLLTVANRFGQLAFKELVRDGLIRVHNMAFTNGVASSWSPVQGVVIDPKIQFGRPCIAGTRIPTGDVAGMYEAGDGIEFLASSYGIDADQINTAIAWEGELATKKVRE